MRQLDLGRTRIAGATAALAVVTAIVVSAPVARADDATGTPTPPATSTSASGTSGAGSTDPTTTDTSTGTTTAPPTTSTTTPPPTTPPPTTTPPTTPPPPVAVVSAASGVWKVKDLQVRLRLVRSTYWPYAVSGTYGSTLGQKVLAFQRDQRLAANGVVDRATWTRLVALTRTATAVSAGSGVWKVKDLQVRLHLAGSAYWPYAISGVYGWTLGQKVLAFQRLQNLPQSGVVDQRTWARLVALTRTVTVLGPGSPAANVRELQRRLGTKGLWPYAASGVYGWTLGQKVLAFQRVQMLAESGVVDQRTWARLLAVTYVPGTFDKHRFAAGLRPILPKVGSLDPRCRVGRVMCVSKDTRTLTWVVDGKPLMVMWARFGGPGRETREGTFRVSRKYEYVISNLYFTPMPYSMFFSGGQAVHYSSNFARLGYASSSHGCVNIADHAQVKSLFFKVRVGDKVVVYN
ncbi:L,D-transpeptidase family protein [Intrasporangium sp. YIM S08009]|uniref:L,D-transpeptidase family protein n=1 Tax=Intrasporangium zincisolvens TaxID=3080018 RepID=UPI002B060F08|nr:L,D-transpeptidase family protein [Intrasporangium sp. YIM S08009]